jgi:hypothetical protein
MGFGVKIDHVPKNFYLNGTYAALSIQAPQLLNLSGNYMWPYLWDLVSVYIGRIFSQVAQRAVSLPRRVVAQSLLEGEYNLEVLGNEALGELEFYLTDGMYPLIPGNFLSFYNATGSNLTISGRLSDIKNLKLRSNQTSTKIEADLASPHEFRLLNSHGLGASDFELLYLSKIPGHLTINIDNSSLSYSADENINRFEFLARTSDLHLYMRILDMPKRLNLNQSDSEILLETFDEAITTLEFQVTESRALSIDGNYLMLVTENETNTLSGRLSNLKRLYFSGLKTTNVSLSFDSQSPFRIVGRRETGNPEDKLELDVFLDNLPNELSLSFENDRVNTSVDVLDIGSISGVSDITGTLSGIADIGGTMLSLMANITSLLTSELGSFSGGFSLYYTFEEEYDLNLIARIDSGDVSQIEECIWTHGICARGISDGPLSARVFLTGIPQSTEIRLEEELERRTLNFSISNFSPGYDWFLLDVKIQGELEFLFYADNLTGKIEEIVINSTFEISPHSTNSMMKTSVRSQTPIENIIMEGMISEPYPTKVEMFLPEIPKMLDLKILAENDISLNYSASEPIEFLMLNVSRNIEDEWHKGTVIAHAIPSQLNIAFETNIQYVRDTPLLGMPSMNVEASSDTLDLYVNMDGRVFGRRGNYEVYLEDLASGLSAYLDNDTYKIRANNLKHLVLKASSMPIMQIYKLKTLKLYVRDLKSLDLKVLMLADTLPAIQIDNADVDDLKVSLSHDMVVAGARFSPDIVLSESTFHHTDNPNLAVPFKSPTHINGLSTSLRSERTTLVFPNLLATIVVTFLPLFIVVLLLLVLLWVMVRVYGRSKEEEESPDEEPEKKSSEKVDGWGKRKKIFAVVILLIIMGGVIFYAFIPRVELKVNTDFVQTPSGIFVVCEASNTGSVLVEDVNVSFNVYNATDELMNGTAFSVNVLKRSDYAEEYVHFFGDQYESYIIHITVYFKAQGRKYQKILSHSAGEYMRMSFEDSIS